MNRLHPVGATLVRADISCFFDRPGDELGTLGVVTEMHPEEEQLRVKIGLGDCGLHGILLSKMGINPGKIPLPEEMAYADLMIRGSSADFNSRTKKTKDLMVACTLSDMREYSKLSPQETAAYAYAASLALGELLRKPRERLDQLKDLSNVVFEGMLIKRLDGQIGKKITTDRE